MIEMGVYSNVVNKGSVKEQLRKVGNFQLSSFTAIYFYIVYTKLAEKMALLASNDLTTVIKITSSGDRLYARDNYWFRSPVPNQMS